MASNLSESDNGQLADETCSEAKKPRLETDRPAEGQDAKQEETIPTKQTDLSAGGDKDGTDSVDAKLLDPLSYTKDKEFTSEIYKVQIHNLPKFGFSDLKKRLKSHLGLNPNKIKSPTSNKYRVAYVCFRSENERDEALTKLNSHVWKGCKLEAKIAAPIADPYLQKRQQAQDKTGTDTPHNGRKDERDMTPEEAEQKLRGNVCPLWNVDYSEQLKEKTNKVKGVLRRVAADDFVKFMFRNTKIQHEGMPCELLPIVPSPVISEYRNKNEFTIGYGLDGKTVTVGFRYGMYKDGTVAVGDCSNLGVAMPAALPVVKSFTEFVKKSRWPPFQQQTGTGHWQTLTVRTYTTGDVMVMVDFVPRDLQQSEVEEARNSVTEFYTNGDGKDININSFYFRVVAGKGRASQSDVKLLFGEKHVYEKLMGLKFRISPEAFFQVNTPATEKLYSLITEWCSASQSTTVLDVCCGTGTIGLALAKNVKEVIGIEMCAQAVEDARANAITNGVTNTKYYSNKVEDVINVVVSSIESRSAATSDVVAVVDPPRAGLHKDVVRSLRKCTNIQRLVYVSCNPESALNNFVDFIRPETSRNKGSPFTLVKAIPVDLFPGTRHCELVLLMTRANVTQGQSSPKVKATEGQSTSEVNSTEVQSSSEVKATEGQSSSEVNTTEVQSSSEVNTTEVQSSSEVNTTEVQSSSKVNATQGHSSSDVNRWS